MPIAIAHRFAMRPFLIVGNRITKAEYTYTHSIYQMVDDLVLLYRA